MASLRRPGHRRLHSAVDQGRRRVPSAAVAPLPLLSGQVHLAQAGPHLRKPWPPHPSRPTHLEVVEPLPYQHLVVPPAGRARLAGEAAPLRLPSGPQVAVAGLAEHLLSAAAALSGQHRRRPSAEGPVARRLPSAAIQVRLVVGAGEPAPARPLPRRASLLPAGEEAEASAETRLLTTVNTRSHVNAFLAEQGSAAGGGPLVWASPSAHKPKGANKLKKLARLNRACNARISRTKTGHKKVVAYYFPTK